MGVMYRKKAAVAASLVAALALTVSACGSSDDDSSGDSGSSSGSSAVVKESEANLKTLTANPKWVGPTKAVKPAPNKTIGIIPCTLAAAGCTRVHDGAVAAAEALGYETVVLDGKGDPQQYLSNVEDLIQQDVDAILNVVIPDSTIPSGLQAAEKAGTPVICTVCGNPPKPDVPVTSDVEVDADYAAQGVAAADFIIANGGGKVVTMNDNIFRPNQVRWEELTKRLNESDNVEIVDDVAITASGDINANHQKVTMGVLQRFPEGELDWITTPADSEGIGQVQAIQATGREEVQTVGYDCDEQNLGFIRDGAGEAACVATPLEWLGWAGMDQVVRILAGEEFVEEPVGIRVITADNVPAEGEPAIDVDFESEYKKLWGVN